MAKYRITRNKDGTYNVQAQLSQGRALLFTKGVKNSEPADLKKVLAGLSNDVQREREKRGMVPVRERIPGLEE